MPFSEGILLRASEARKEATKPERDERDGLARTYMRIAAMLPGIWANYIKHDLHKLFRTKRGQLTPWLISPDN